MRSAAQKTADAKQSQAMKVRHAIIRAHKKNGNLTRGVGFKASVKRLQKVAGPAYG